MQSYELVEVLKRAQHQELQQAAKLASTETQAEAVIRKQAQQHAEEIRKERFKTPSPNTRLAKSKHPTTPTGTPSPQKEARLEQISTPNTSPINPVPLPPPQTQASSSLSAPTPKARAKPISSSRKGTNKKLATQKHRPEKTRQGRSASPQATQPETTGRSRSRAESDTTRTRKQLAPSVIGIQKVREELEQAKNNKKLSVADASEYMKLYDEWKAAEGNKAVQGEKLKGLREIYRAVYKK